MNECPIVETSLGKVKGRVVNNVDKGRDVYRYSSIPFAKPPVGEIRFKPPVKPAPWEGVLDGTKHSASPQQDSEDRVKMAKFFPQPETFTIKNISEDCLYLSVYTTTTTSKSANLPVLLWIYGGGFHMGGEVCYDGSVLAALHDVVVVVPNYRVSLFGFLSLGPDSEIPGNAGLLDQLMAMKWTREHISNFGGNPQNVTIFGESAGAACVNYHMVSPLSRGYFDKAISHSGNIYMGDYLQKADGQLITSLGSELKMEENDEHEIVAKLTSIPVERILKATSTLQKKLNYFLPSIDGNFLSKDINGLTQDKLHPVPYVIGCNNSEGSGIMTVDRPENFNQGITEETCIGTLKGFIQYVIYKGLSDSAFDLIIKEYSKDIPDGKMKWSQIYGEILGDVMFVLPTSKALEQARRSGNKAYMYVMTQTPKYNHDSKYGPESARKVPFCKCDHADDLIFTFGMPLSRDGASRYTEDERKLSGEWMKYIVNFARNSDPNCGEPVKMKWPQYDCTEQSYLSVQQPCSVGKSFSADRMKFWKEIIEPMKNSS